MVRRAFALAAGLCLAAASLVNAQQAPAAGQPPIVDRELYFGDPEISGAQLSPDGRFIAFLKPLKGTRNIWVKSSSEPFEKARPITADTKRPIASFFWSRDSRAVLYVQDQGGDENYNVYAVDPAAPPSGGAGVPPARNLTAAKNVRAFIYAVPKSEPDAIYVGLNDREPAWHDLYKVRISTGERQLLRKNTERLTGYGRRFLDAGNRQWGEKMQDDITWGVEYIVAPDEGHGFARPVNNMAAFAAAERFLATHLKGRFQEGGTPEVMARLKEITVDPKSVVLKKKADAGSVKTPTPASDLSPGSWAYAVTISMGGQSMDLAPPCRSPRQARACKDGPAFATP